MGTKSNPSKSTKKSESVYETEKAISYSGKSGTSLRVFPARNGGVYKVESEKRNGTTVVLSVVLASFGVKPVPAIDFLSRFREITDSLDSSPTGKVLAEEIRNLERETKKPYRNLKTLRSRRREEKRDVRSSFRRSRFFRR